MGTINAFNLHNQHVEEYLRCLIFSFMPARRVIDGCDMLKESDFGGYWQASEIWRATRNAAETEILLSNDSARIGVQDVHQALIGSGALKQEPMAHAWTYFVSPPRAEPIFPAEKLGELARRIVEDNYRTRHVDIYGDRGGWVAPLAELRAQVDRDTRELDAIAARLDYMTAGGQGAAKAVA